MKKLLTCCLLIYAIFLMGCPKETAVRKAANASYQLAGITGDVINGVGKAYDAGILSLATKDKLAAQLKLVVSGGKKFNLAIEALNATPSPADISILNQIFSEQVVAPFLAILEELKVLLPNQADYLHTAITALRTAILIISGVFADSGYTQRSLINA